MEDSVLNMLIVVMESRIGRKLTSQEKEQVARRTKAYRLLMERSIDQQGKEILKDWRLI